MAAEDENARLMANSPARTRCALLPYILLVPTEEAESDTVIRYVTGPPHAVGSRRELWILL